MDDIESRTGRVFQQEDLQDSEDEALIRLHSLALDAIRELPERCRIIFNMSRETDLTNREIAEKLGLSEKTIENQITIALKKLRAKLGPHMDKLMVTILLFFLLSFFWG
jgi:RNA polymerase sigma-70 factor, ECF subfamily